jgi:hypothetical protein
MSREICIVTPAGKTLSPIAAQFAAIAERVLRDTSVSSEP